MVQFEKIESVAKIILNRPDKYNSFVREMAFELQKKLHKCKIDDAIRCILITGAGKAFCAGQDLMEATDPNGPEIEEIVLIHYNHIIYILFVKKRDYIVVLELFCSFVVYKSNFFKNEYKA